MNTGDRLLSVLRLYTPDASEWTVEEAAGKLKVSVSTAYRYFRSFCKIGLLDPLESGTYVLGPAIVEYDRQIRATDPMIRAGLGVMQRLVARSGGSGISLLCRIYRNCVMCIHQEADPSSTIATSYERGRLMPMYRGASSKVIFANLPARVVRWHFARSAHQIADARLGSSLETVKANLKRIRREGVVVARGEVDSGRVGIASAIMGPKKNVLGSIALVILQRDATPEAIANYSALVEAASREMHVGMNNLKKVEVFKSLQPHDHGDSFDPSDQGMGFGKN